MFSSNEVCQLTGISYRMLDYWVRTDTIGPEMQARGSGSQRRWTAAQVDEVFLAASLRRAGVSLDVIAATVGRVRDTHAEALVILDGEVLPVETEANIADAVELLGGAAVVVLRSSWTSSPEA